MSTRIPTAPAADAFWRPLLWLAGIELAYAVLTRVAFAALFQGSPLELATTAARLVTIALYWYLFPDLIRRREPRSGELTRIWPLLAMCVMLLNPLLSGNDGWPTWTDKLVFALTSFVVGPREEIAYRAVLQNLLERRLSWPAALALGSVLFALYHYGYGGWPFTPRRFADLFLSGVALGLLYRHSGSLLAVALLHSLLDVLWSLSPWLASPLPTTWRPLMGLLAVLLLVPWGLAASRRPR